MSFLIFAVYVLFDPANSHALGEGPPAKAAGLEALTAQGDLEAQQKALDHLGSLTREEVELLVENPRMLQPGGDTSDTDTVMIVLIVVLAVLVVLILAAAIAKPRVRMSFG